MKRNRFILNSWIIVFALFFSQCQRDKHKQIFVVTPTNKTTLAVSFPFFLFEKTMILNREQDNEIEGTYLKVIEKINDSTFKINLPPDFYLTDKDLSQWMLGWPTGKAYYDAGNENLRQIKTLDSKTGAVVLGNLLRGTAFPGLNQRVVFWSKSPSGFANSSSGAAIRPEWWKDFAGNSIEFGAIIFDSLSKQWITYLQEVDTVSMRIYAATSTNLRDWKPYKNKALFSPADFKNTTWAGLAEDGKTPQTPRLYTALYDKGIYYLFLSAYGKSGYRHIGLVTTKNLLTGPFTIYPEPVISPEAGSYDCRGCFYPKIARADNRFLLYYDGVDAEGVERVCLAESEDLTHWKKSTHNPVLDNHYGWRSGPFTSEPNYVQCSNDSVWLMAGGYKKYNTEFSERDSAEGRLPLDKAIFKKAEQDKGMYVSGNVMDAQLGVFLSTDGGYTFRPHINNPVWINDYSDSLQNDHIGGNFFNNGHIILYQAKSETQKRYNILVREK